MSKLDFTDKDFIRLLEIIQNQWAEDRTAAVTCYGELKKLINTSQEFALNGDNLTKLIDLMSKQTQQIIDLAKVFYKDKTKESSTKLGESEIENVFDEIKDKVQ